MFCMFEFMCRHRLLPPSSTARSAASLCVALALTSAVRHCTGQEYIGQEGTPATRAKPTDEALIAAWGFLGLFCIASFATGVTGALGAWWRCHPRRTLTCHPCGRLCCRVAVAPSTLPVLPHAAIRPPLRPRLLQLVQDEPGVRLHVARVLRRHDRRPQRPPDNRVPVVLRPALVSSHAVPAALSQVRLPRLAGRASHRGEPPRLLATAGGGALP
jgi:hypothetical protein